MLHRGTHSRFRISAPIVRSLSSFLSHSAAWIGSASGDLLSGSRPVGRECSPGISSTCPLHRRRPDPPVAAECVTAVGRRPSTRASSSSTAVASTPSWATRRHVKHDVVPTPSTAECSRDPATRGSCERRRGSAGSWSWVPSVGPPPQGCLDAQVAWSPIRSVGSAQLPFQRYERASSVDPGGAHRSADGVSLGVSKPAADPGSSG
jgi:hypothetical protein